MSGQYLQKKFNIDWSKFDTRLLTKDLSPRNNDSHFIADSFKKSGQESDPKLKAFNKAKKVTPFTCNNIESVNKNTTTNSNMLKEQYNVSQQNKLMDRYNSLNSDGGINQDNSASDRYTVKLKRMKKTIDAIHSIGKKINAGKNSKTNCKLSNNKDKSCEPKTVKKTNVNVVTPKQASNIAKIQEKTNTINLKKSFKPRAQLSVNNNNIQTQYNESRNSNITNFDMRKVTENISIKPNNQQAPLIMGNSNNQKFSNVPNLKQTLNYPQDVNHQQEANTNQIMKNKPELESGLKKLSNMDQVNHLSHNQITHTRKDLASESRTRNFVSGHRKAQESYDSKITTNCSSSNGFKNNRNLKTGIYTTHKFNTGNSLLYKNATQGHEEKLSIRKKGTGYINMKSYREKIDVKATSKKKTTDFNKENRQETNNLSRMNAVSAIKSSINIIDDKSYNAKKCPTFTQALAVSNERSQKKIKKTNFSKQNNFINSNSEIVMDNNSDLISTSNILNQVSAIKTNETDLPDDLLCNDEIERCTSEEKAELDILNSDDELVIKDVNIEVLACDDEEIIDLTQKKNQNINTEKECIDEMKVFKETKIDGDSYDENDSTRDDEDEFDVLKNFMSDELIYKVDFQTIEKNQTEIKPKMRAILYDWMSEVCNDYMFKRDTYYTATKLVDIYQMNHRGVKKSEFQLVGLCAIFISMKMLEIVAICAEDLLYCTSNVFSQKDLLVMEDNMVNNTNWMLSPMTLNHWVNLLTHNWDMFASCLSSYMSIPASSVYVFRESEKTSYLQFREQCQLVDTSVLVPETTQYNGGLLIAAFLYLLIGINLEYFDKNDVVESFSKTSYYILDEDCTYNLVFTKFLSASLKIQLSELLPYSQYAARFFSLTLDYSVPNACRIYDYVNRPYEDMLSYQAHNQNILQFVNDKMI